MAEALKSRCHSWCFNSSPGAKSIPCTEHRERSVLTKSGLNKEMQDKISTIAKKTAKKCLASVFLPSVLTTKHVCKNNHLYGNLCGCNDSTWLCISFLPRHEQPWNSLPAWRKALSRCPEASSQPGNRISICSGMGWFRDKGPSSGDLILII